MVLPMGATSLSCELPGDERVRGELRRAGDLHPE